MVDPIFLLCLALEIPKEARLPIFFIYPIEPAISDEYPLA
jgi:hypothetical protein